MICSKTFSELIICSLFSQKKTRQKIDASFADTVKHTDPPVSEPEA